MNLIRKLFKGPIFVVIVLVFFITCTIADLLVRDKRNKIVTFSQIASFCSKMALIVLGVKVNLKNMDSYINTDKNYMIVSNHLSYLDIFVIYTALPAVFVANAELEEEFLLGDVTRYAGGIFVERRNRTKLLEDMDKISDVLNMGLNIVLFPEATTSNGESVLPFKAPFLKSAIDTENDVLPVCMNYKKINGGPVNKDNRDFIFYYGSIGFFEHFIRLLGVGSIEVEMQALEVIKMNPNMTRKELSQTAYEKISGAYNGIQ